MSKKLVFRSVANQHEIIQIKKNNVWINSFNRVLTFYFQLNHDASWIPINAKSLSVMYYITNYVIKNDFNYSQILLKSTLVNFFFEKSIAISSTMLQFVESSSSPKIKLILKIFNALIQNRKINSVQIASIFLQFNSFFIRFRNFNRLNLWFLKFHVKRMIMSFESTLKFIDHNVIEVISKQTTNETLINSNEIVNENFCIVQTSIRIS